MSFLALVLAAAPLLGTPATPPPSATPAGPAAPALPDLRFEYAYLERGDDEVEPGDRPSLEYAVRNSGPVGASNVAVGFFLSDDDRFSDDDTFLEAENLGTVSSGETDEETEQVTIPLDTAPGCYRLLLVVDYDDRIAESDETNNVRGARIAVGVPATSCEGWPLPDLTVEDPSVTPAGPLTPGQAITTAATLRNEGEATAGFSPDLFYALSTDPVWDGPFADIVLSIDQVENGLRPGQAARLSDTSVVPAVAPGAYYVLFVADASGSVTESDETNNVAAVPVTIAASEGLTVAASATPSTVSPGVTITVTATVTNTTPSAAALDGWVEAERGGSVVLEERVGSGTVAAGAAATVTFELDVPRGAGGGAYAVAFRVGTYPTEAVASDTFTVTVVTRRVAEGSPGATGSEAFAVQQVGGGLFGSGLSGSGLPGDGPAAGSASAGAEAPTLAAWPNPAADAVTLSYTLQEASPVRLAVYDALGREVAVLADGLREAGRHDAALDGLPAGVYLLQLTASGATTTRRVTFLE